ncbi:hypothetical protein CBS101457_002473 [Exobasidium rhododendri]|nr:hypothetical protein CBS101457_002473 [Exobasidium rhododendri]
MNGKDNDETTPPAFLRRTSSSNANVASMPAYGVSPTIPNIPLRSSSPHINSPALSAQQTDRLQEQDLHLDSEGHTPVNSNDLDSLPISDEQKARIIERHLARGDSSALQVPGGDTNASGEESSRSRDRSSSRPTSHADSHSSAADSEQIEEVGEEEYRGPHNMQGGAITDDVYRWAHNNKRKVSRRTRSESLHLPRLSTIDPDLDTSAIKEPGGFRRFFILNQAAEQGRPPPRALRSFVDFLSLYGHFAGERLEDDDDDDEDDDDEDQLEDQRAIAGTSRGAGTGSTESSQLLRKRRGMKRSGSRLRRGSADGDRERGEATVTDAVLMLLKSFVGTGILFLGKAFHNGGLLFSAIVLCLIAMISLASFLLLVKVNLKHPASFGEMGGLLYGPKMRLAILFSIVFSQLGFVAAYTVFVAQNLQAFVLAVTHCRTMIPTVYFILAQTAIFLPLSLIRKIAKLSSTALIADVFILLGIIYLFSYEIKQVATHGMADVVQFNSKSFPLFIGTAVFTFEGIGLVIPITESMKEPERFPAALSGVMVFVMILFATSGSLSYMAFGSKVQTVVISNLPQTWKFVQAMQFLYSVAILLSTPLQLFPAVSILERGLFSTKSGKYNNTVKLSKNLFRCSIVLVATLAAWLGSNSLDVFVSFIGSVACVPLCFIYPPLLHLRGCATKRRTIILDYLLLSFGVICCLFAGSQTIRTLIVGGESPDQPVCSPPK